MKCLCMPLAAAAAVLLLASPAAQAAKVVSQDHYVLEEGETLSDDLVVWAGESRIKGRVEGDLIVAGGEVQMAGEIGQDLIVWGGHVVIAGTVEDDVRGAGGEVIVEGEIGDDAFLAGGDVRLAESSRILGSAYVAGGDVVLDGEIGRDCRVAGGSVELAAAVGGDAWAYSGELTVRETTHVEGALYYGSGEPVDIPEGVAGEVIMKGRPAEEHVGPPFPSVWRLVRALLVLAGFALLATLLHTLAPGVLHAPANVLARNPAASGGLGLVLFLAFFTLGPALVVMLAIVAALFWGWLAAVVAGLSLFALALLFGVVWVWSPLVTGSWLGRRLLKREGLAPVLLGVLLVAAIGQAPAVGFFVYILSFALAAGASVLLLVRRRWRQSTMNSTSEVTS